MLALLGVHSLEALELEMNMVMAEIGWGSVELTLDDGSAAEPTHGRSEWWSIKHRGEPRAGLEGLYQGWTGQQAGADPSFNARVMTYEDDAVIIRYGC